MKNNTKRAPIPKEVSRRILSTPGASRQIAKLSRVSKAYVSLVLHGKKPPSQKLMEGMCRYFEAAATEPLSFLALWEVKNVMEAGQEAR